jgi:hypothetical protein
MDDLSQTPTVFAGKFSPFSSVPNFINEPLSGLLELWISRARFLGSAYPSNCGKKERSVLLFSIVAAVSTSFPSPMSVCFLRIGIFLKENSALGSRINDDRECARVSGCRFFPSCRWFRVSIRHLDGLYLSHRGALEFDTMRVVNKAVQDTVGNGGVADLIMPMS